MEVIRGSEWKKWDLHIHNPFTKLNNGFNSITIDGEIKKCLTDEQKLDYFCDILEKSDVSVIGITDYFDYKTSNRTIEHFKKKYPQSEKTLLYNIELRLDNSVNKSGQYINIHLIFSESIETRKIETFSHSLKIKCSNQNARKLIDVQDLSEKEVKTVMVTIDNLIQGLRDTFGENYQDSVIVVASARNDGISPGKIKEGSDFNKDRSHTLIDDIDRNCDGIFSRSADSKYWLRSDRYAPKSKSLPTFGGCDAHSFDDLTLMLGKTGCNNQRSWDTTWIKATPNFHGLLQTLIEPEDRVKIQEQEPDFKEDFHVIDKIIFNDNEITSDKPIYLNKNLNSVIGSRSSGKSALLTYIAYAIDKESTKKALEDTGLNSASEGPAAGISWTEAENNNYIPKVIWKDSKFNSGKAIFVPQNSLFALSSRPIEITEKIINLIKTKNVELYNYFDDSLKTISSISNTIKDLVERWFEIEQGIRNMQNSGEIPLDKETVQRALDTAREELILARENSQLTKQEILQINKVKGEKEELRFVESQQKNYLEKVNYLLKRDLSTSLQILLTVDADSTNYFEQLPEPIVNQVNEKVTILENELTRFINEQLKNLKSNANQLIEDSSKKIGSLDKEFGSLEKKYNESRIIEVLESKIEGYNSSIKKIEEIENQIKLNREQQSVIIDGIASLRDKATATQSEIIDNFENSVEIEDIKFFAEIGKSDSAESNIIECINKQRNNFYYDKINELFEFSKVDDDIKLFLQSCFYQNSNEIHFKEIINNHQGRLEFAKKVLSYTNDIRIGAIYADDKIGGFGKSTMTPGKQSLFALTLILASSDHKWPLLIDQPEDDLDSRSIYETIVPYLKERKKERQIIMVTHNANMAIGSDSEQIIVVNRNSSDAKNKDDKFFQYKNGPLEDSLTNTKSTVYLDKFGIKENCCLLLDGGEDAFENRKLKYSI